MNWTGHWAAWRPRLYWTLYLLVPAAAFLLGYLAGPLQRPSMEGRTIESEVGPVLMISLKWVLGTSWLGLWILGPMLDARSNARWSLHTFSRNVPDVLLLLFGVLVLAPLALGAGIFTSPREWLRITCEPRIEVVDDLGTAWVIEGEGFQDPNWVVRRAREPGWWRVENEILGSIAVSPWERGVHVLRPASDCILQSHRLKGVRLEFREGGRLSAFTDDGRCSFSYDTRLDRAWGISVNGPEGAGFPPFFVLLGESAAPDSRDVEVVLDAVRSSAARPPAEVFLDIRHSGLIPSDDDVGAGLSSGNFEVRKVAKRIAEVGGPALYPASTRAIQDGR